MLLFLVRLECCIWFVSRIQNEVLEMWHLCCVVQAGWYILRSSYRKLKAMRRSAVKLELVKVLFIFSRNGVIALTGLWDQTAQIVKNDMSNVPEIWVYSSDLFCVLSLVNQHLLPAMKWKLSFHFQLVDVILGEYLVA